MIDSPLGPVALGKQLGQGGNAVVYAAENLDRVAVKLLSEDVSGGESERFRRFRAEYLHLVRLVPTGLVVPLYQFGIVDVDAARVPYILMERCEGTLKDQLQDNPIRDEAAFLALLNRLLDSLEAVHREGIVHRDLKPENVLVRTNGDRVLGDFGIAWFDPVRHVRDVETKGGDRLGNIAFSAPEQIRRDMGEPSPAMDYYALGQVLYWSVTGTTIRGTSHQSLQTFASELAQFDPVVTALVRQDPLERPTAPGAVHALVVAREKSPEAERYWAMHRAQNVFDDALAKGLPGSYRATLVPPEKLSRVLESVADVCVEADLEFLMSRGETKACPMREEDGRWVIGGFECWVAEAWVYRSPTQERQFVLLRLQESEPFPVRGPHASGDYDEAGWVDGRYVRREEVDDGYAELDGQVVSVYGAELRIRLLDGPVVLVAPHYSVASMGGARGGGRREREDRLATISQAGTVSEEDVEELGQMERPWWMTMYD